MQNTSNKENTEISAVTIDTRNGKIILSRRDNSEDTITINQPEYSYKRIVQKDKTILPDEADCLVLQYVLFRQNGVFRLPWQKKRFMEQMAAVLCNAKNSGKMTPQMLFTYKQLTDRYCINFTKNGDLVTKANLIERPHH